MIYKYTLLSSEKTFEEEMTVTVLWDTVSEYIRQNRVASCLSDEGYGHGLIV